MKTLAYYLLDVFAESAFGGNPLAVFPEADGLSDTSMQRIATELNLSETTLVQKPSRPSSDCTVRIFTPKQELPMAGHPTIGTAHTLLHHQLIEPQNAKHLVFDEGVGAVKVDILNKPDDPSGSWDLMMHQPLPEFSHTVARAALAKVLSLKPSDFLQGQPAQIVSCGVPVLVVPLSSLQAVGSAALRLDHLETELAPFGCQEILIFSQETERPESDTHCRFFAPRFGIPEDPATGGAHGPLGAYLIRHGLHTNRLIRSEQGMEMGRPSFLTVEIEHQAPDTITRIKVGGRCIAMGQGQMRLPAA